MINTLKEILSERFSFLDKRRLLLAVSGGKDSMVLLHLFQNLNYDFAIAHCNFQLRGIESFEDQNFIKTYAENHGIPVFITQFDTKAFAEDYKVSTQVAARELRYNWFYELLETENFDYVITAHHADDSLETFLINLSRGTGIEGLTGIPEQNDKIIRPLLTFTLEEIELYAAENGIEWREDSSNASDKYLRNKIRHHLVPILKDLNSNFLVSFQKTQNYLQEAQVMVEDAAIMIYQQVAKQEDDSIYFDLNKLKKLPNYQSYLYQWLNEFGFTAWDDIYNLVESQTGKFVYSPTYRLLKDRNYLILSPINYVNPAEEYFISENQKEVNIPLNLTFCKVADISIATNTSIFVDSDLLHYPLRLQKWSEGAVFHPFGMQGKSKKVSKFFKDEKLSLNEKEQTWLLYSDEKIVWIVGLRPDERFKVTETTKNILKIELR
ncbi:tRNA lysidine(34) synthetase TilS [Flavobacterium sp. K77]|uniref:tRNA(Ile)-lysidine synthase n=1 Tax=Flavobacterium turcicum TaxID=2764718 RepID=A0ABR7JDP2_9FLAO|nr:MULTISPECIES: tRNA lysidine(34) synthetase TilS [Flavobacterium]MBC5862582.1 tRNA lysidine(34) synthetase TilS [Flavobacterium turcicum]MCF6141876.1 tRNA lysidine(34) synthetase TilS [Flavobacterium sp. K77]NHL01314.1 tRNA lysidine(34) synthetase TilS [Flavobacterium turcicum]